MNDEQSRAGTTNAWFPLAVVAGFVLLVMMGASHHEMWRDEVRALSIARAGPLHLASNLRNEGHPALWYLLLWATSAAMGGSSLALPLASAVVATAAVWVFARFAPFPMWQRAMFAFGFFPAYEYSVMSRSYGLGMLLLFVYCAVASSRSPRPIARGVALALLANTSVHALLLASALLLAWGLDFLTALRSAEGRERDRANAAGFIIAAAGMAISVWTMWPEAPSAVEMMSHTTVGTHKPSSIGKALNVGGAFGDAFFPNLLHWSKTVESLLVDVLLILVGFVLSNRRTLLLAHLWGALGLAALFAFLYRGSTRHQGLELMFVLALLWLWRVQTQSAPRPRRSIVAWGILAVLLPIHVARAVTAYQVEVATTKSSAAAFSTWLDARPEYRNAILICKPAYLLETMPYYGTRRLYRWQEEQFAQWEGKQYPLRHRLFRELIETAKALEVRERAPVLLLMGRELQLVQAPNKNDHLPSTSDERAQFLRETVLVARFTDATTDERFVVYALRGAMVEPPR